MHANFTCVAMCLCIGGMRITLYYAMNALHTLDYLQ